jgi:hypothetical protein
MKLYIPAPPPTEQMMRISIKQQGTKDHHIIVKEVEQHELIDWLKKLISAQNLDIFAEGLSTTVQVREYTSFTNGKTVSFKFKGMNPEQVHGLIMKSIPK